MRDGLSGWRTDGMKQMAKSEWRMDQIEQMAGVNGGEMGWSSWLE
jgi:hypothetical protein